MKISGTRKKKGSLIFFMLLSAAIISCSDVPDYSGSSEDSPYGELIINDGDYYTTSASVYLSLDVPGADEMCFSNDNITWSAWEPYTDTKNWSIDTGHGQKTVFGNFRKSGTEIAVFSDTITPFFEHHIYASDGAASTYFGGGNTGYTTENLCISENGNIIIVGAAMNSAVYVYKKSGTGWDEIQISKPDGSGSSFGNSIACNPDASIVVIGALSKPGFYLYQWNGASYDLINTINSPTAPQTNDFAVTVSISNDGNKIAVGSWHHPMGENKGAVYLYERDKASWPGSYEKKFMEDELVNNDIYGIGVKISGDGNTIAIGASYQESQYGAVYIYKWNGSDWNLITKFSGTSNYLLGRHIGMSYNGSRIIASERAWSYGNTDQGAAHIYNWNGTTYTETKILSASDGAADDKFGYCVSMSSNGNIIAVSAPSISTAIGAAYVYRFDGTDWIEEYKLTASDGTAGDFYGNMISISGDGSVVAVGAPLDDVVNTDQGSVYLYY
ncbi:MAG TPA: FG-GAP repeat protein [Spirochaetota bacterium]|nr:FG-GAP repeat protein [Spirochaetota bacterium]